MNRFSGIVSAGIHQWHTGANRYRILMDNHIRRRIGLADSMLDTFRQLMGLTQRQILVHIHVQLDKLCPPGLASTQVMKPQRLRMFCHYRPDHIAYIPWNLPVQQ